MKRDRSLVISAVLGLSVLIGGCANNQPNADTKSDKTTSDSKMALQSKEIVAQNVLAAQLAKHHEIESKTAFGQTEPIYASVYLTTPQHIEPRRISAFLVLGEDVVEEQSIAVGANEKRQEFDFSFTQTPRPSGAYKIKFVEVTRSHGKPILLARLFLNVE
jgi:outer membrane murein-binding lipoprotein Lpp